MPFITYIRKEQIMRGVTRKVFDQTCDIVHSNFVQTGYLIKGIEANHKLMKNA